VGSVLLQVLFVRCKIAYMRSLLLPEFQNGRPIFKIADQRKTC